MENIVFDLSVAVQGLDGIKKIEERISEIEAEVKGVNGTPVNIKVSDSLKQLQKLYKEIVQMKKAMENMIPNDSKSYKAMSQYASSLQNVIQQVANLKKKLSENGASETDLMIPDLMSQDLQGCLKNAEEGIDSYINKISEAENKLQQWSQNAVKVFNGERSLKRNKQIIKELQNSMQELTSLDPNLEIIKSEDIQKGESYVKILSQIQDVISGSEFDLKKFQEIEENLKTIGIQSDSLEKSFEGLFAGKTSKKLTSLTDELKTVMSEVELKLQNGFSGTDEIKKYKDQITDLKKEIKSLDKAFDFQNTIGGNFWQVWGQLVQRSQTPNGKKKKKTDSVPIDQSLDVESTTPPFSSNSGQQSKKKYRINSHPPKIQQNPSSAPPLNPPSQPPINPSSPHSQKSNKVIAVSGGSRSLKEDLLTIGKEADIDPDIVIKAEKDLKNLIGTGMKIDSYRINFSNDDDGIQARTIALRALNEETNEALNLTMQFDRQGNHHIDFDDLTYTNNKSAVDRRNAQKEQSSIDQRYAESINKQIAAEKELAKQQNLRSHAQVENRGQYDERIAAQEKLIQYEQTYQQQLQASNAMQTKSAERLQAARGRLDTYYKNISSSNILEKFNANEIAGLSNTLNDDTKLNGYADAVKRAQENYANLVRFVSNNDLADNANMEKAESQAKELQETLDAIRNGSFDKVNKSGTFVTTLSNDMQKAREEAEALVKAMNGVDAKSLKWSKDGSSLSYSQSGDGKTVTKYANIVSGLDGVNQLRTFSTGTESHVSKLKSILSSGLGSIKEQALELGTMYMGFQDMINYLQQGISVYKDYDAALTDISYTTEGATEQINAMGRSYVSLAKDLSSTVSDSMEVASIYANLQTSTEEVMQSVKPTLMLSNTTGVDAATASDQIQGVLEQFSLGTDQAEHVVDVMEQISSNLKEDFGKAINNVAEGVQAAGQSAADAGMTFEQLAAVIGKVSEKTRDSGSEIGNSLKTILTRISKASTMADEVDNESISKAAAALHSVGVEVYEQDGTFRNFITIITELQQKWDSLTDSQQANIAYEVAATRQTNRFKLMLDGWVESMSMADEATNNSTGYAEELQEKYENSFNGKLTKLKATSDEFWINFLDNNTTKDIVDKITSIVQALTELTNATNPLVTAGVFAGGGNLFKKITSISKERKKQGKEGLISTALG